MVPESGHLGYYARVNDKATVTIVLFFFWRRSSGSHTHEHTRAYSVLQTWSILPVTLHETIMLNYICGYIKDSSLKSQHLFVSSLCLFHPLLLYVFDRLLSFTWLNKHLIHLWWRTSHSVFNIFSFFFENGQFCRNSHDIQDEDVSCGS